MPPSDLRRPARWRGPARGQVAAWSVLPAAAVVIIVGGLFWASVWMIFRPRLIPNPPPAVAAVAPPTRPVPSAYGGDDPGEYPLDVIAGDAIADRQVAEYDDEDLDSLDSEAVVDPPDEIDDLTTDLALGPVYGPPYIAGGADAVASDDSGDDYVADAGDPSSARSEELTARAAELASRTQELTAKAEELTARIEGLTSRMEELQTRIEVSGNVLAAAPAAVPSPVALPRPNEPTTVRTSAQSGTGQAAGNGQAAAGASGRAPWVVLPQPEPGSKVAAGPIVLEARARGEAPITQIRVQLDGVALQVAMDRRDDTTWRGRASTKVTPGAHTVAISVVDGQGRVGSYRWQFNATGS